MTGSWLDRWTAFIVRQPKLTLSVLAAFTLLAAWIAVSQFSMNSDTSRLIRQDTEWRRHHDALVTAFPQYDKNSFVVVSGHQPAAVLATARELAAELRASPAFRRV